MMTIEQRDAILEILDDCEQSLHIINLRNLLMRTPMETLAERQKRERLLGSYKYFRFHTSEALPEDTILMVSKPWKENPHIVKAVNIKRPGS